MPKNHCFPIENIFVTKTVSAGPDRCTRNATLFPIPLKSKLSLLKFIV